ncbi:uncharacterized protein LOC133288081 [Gastrolobium bilobum]|uniref:uncharacterized protein LOC133288081 n=1 Tax=Gastrolobium bilobum TaxID=150636 RepID=UPI002AAF9697|nr:uncharacterized protein LOC133288081 [Gastrolobium bilobum]
MALISELLANVILLVTWPFSLLKLACLFGIRTALLVIYTWMELLGATISLIITWTFGLVSLPARVVNYFQRERQLEQILHQMQKELEKRALDQKELQEQLEMAVKERKLMELVVAEVEKEHDMAIAKIEKLESKSRDQTNENLRLKEIQGKKYWSSKDKQIIDNGKNTDEGSSSIPRPIRSRKPNYNETGKAFQDLLKRDDIWEDERKTRSELLKLLKTESVPRVKPEKISKDEKMREVLDHRREVALSQSLFSAFLSLVVGVIVWEAKDPCVPLVVALFTVVGMSLRSVVKFFSIIKNKPASDAVALLSFNWFILGTLTYPTLPSVIRMLAPYVLPLMKQTMNRLGLLSLA